MSWIKWQIFKICLRYNWNFTTTYKGRIWSTRKGFDPRRQRIYFSGDMDFTSFSGGYTPTTHRKETKSK